MVEVVCSTRDMFFMDSVLSCTPLVRCLQPLTAADKRFNPSHRPRGRADCVVVFPLHAGSCCKCRPLFFYLHIAAFLFF